MISYVQLKEKIDAGEVSWECTHDTDIKELFHNHREEFFEELEMKMYLDYDESKGYAILWNRCHMCGENIRYVYKDNHFVSNKDECFEKTPFAVEVEFPTGNLILADQLEYAEELFEHLYERSGRLRSEKAIRNKSEVFAQENVMHFFVSNTCPTVNQLPNGFSVGRKGLDEDDYDIPFDDGVEVGSICTDLWWVTVIDYMHYEQMAIGKFGEEEGRRMATEAKECADVVVQVEPGRYRCHYNWFKDKTPELLLRVEKI